MTKLGYDGQFSDPDSGLLYLRARWYDPTTAQFVSVDPALATTHQAYVYAGDDPVNEVDLAGLQGSAGLSAEQRYRNQVANKCDGHPERNGCRGIDVVGDLEKEKTRIALLVAGVALVVGATVLTGGLADVLVATAFETLAEEETLAPLEVAELAVHAPFVLGPGICLGGGGAALIYTAFEDPKGNKDEKNNN